MKRRIIKTILMGLALGQIAAVEGGQLASSDHWRVNFRGTGSHGAKPHQGRDAVTAAGVSLRRLQRRR